MESRASLGSTHLGDVRLATQASDMEVKLVHGAKYYINIPRTCPVFNSALLDKAALSCLVRLKDIYETLDSGDVTTFLLFIDNSLKVTTSISRTLSLLFRNPCIW